MEGNKYISSAIISLKIQSLYIRGDVSTADYVRGGGTELVLQEQFCIQMGLGNVSNPINSPCYVRNLRVFKTINLQINSAQLMGNKF